MKAMTFKQKGCKSPRLLGWKQEKAEPDYKAPKQVRFDTGGKS
jgi:hypothetical protein